MINFTVGDTVTTRKAHVCGCNTWQIVRTGADYKLKCSKCGHIVLLSAEKFRKAVKQSEQCR